eukprot:3862449-Rhodomonas_salina.1
MYPMIPRAHLHDQALRRSRSQGCLRFIRHAYATSTQSQLQCQTEAFELLVRPQSPQATRVPGKRVNGHVHPAPDRLNGWAETGRWCPGPENLRVVYLLGRLDPDNENPDSGLPAIRENC